MSRAYVIMGVAGSGKTTVGQALAGRLGVPFYDGDDFHPPENVAKMSAGIPLTDADREPWLERLHDLIADHLARNATVVIACSALKQSYRAQLRAGNAGLRIVYLAGDMDLINARLSRRAGHFMKAEMLQSQFDALEPPSPQDALIVAVDQDVETIVNKIIEYEK